MKVRPRAELVEDYAGARAKFSRDDDVDGFVWLYRWEALDPAWYRRWRREWLTYDRAISIHEAAHALAALVAGHHVEAVVMHPVDDATAAGYMRHRRPHDIAAKLHENPMGIVDELVILAAGRLAERLLVPDMPRDAIERGAASDLAKLEAVYALALDEKTQRWLRDQVFLQTYSLVRQHRREIRAVARALRRRRHGRPMPCSAVLRAMGRMPVQLALWSR